MTSARLAALVGSVILGCAPGSNGGDGGPARDTDVGPPAACGPDVACGTDAPFLGTPCTEGLECFFPVLGCVGERRFFCADGTWQFEGPAPEGCAIGGFVPPEPETCRAPFGGSATGNVSIAPVEAFQWGPQGGAMLAIDLTVDGEAAEQWCVRASVAVTIDGRLLPEARYGLRLRCGQSHGIFVILDESPCEERLYAVTVTATIDGVGVGTSAVELMGGQTSGPPTCP